MVYPSPSEPASVMVISESATESGMVCPSPPEPASVMVVSESATESGMVCPSSAAYECPSDDDDVEIYDSIADEDYVPASCSSDSSSDEESDKRLFLPDGLIPHRLHIHMQSPTDPDEESCEIPFCHAEMLQRSKYPQLDRAIRTCTLSGSEDFNAGLKCSLNYLIKKRRHLSSVGDYIQTKQRAC